MQFLWSLNRGRVEVGQQHQQPHQWRLQVASHEDLKKRKMKKPLSAVVRVKVQVILVTVVKTAPEFQCLINGDMTRVRCTIHIRRNDERNPNRRRQRKIPLRVRLVHLRRGKNRPLVLANPEGNISYPPGKHNRRGKEMERMLLWKSPGHLLGQTTE